VSAFPLGVSPFRHSKNFHFLSNGRESGFSKFSFLSKRQGKSFLLKTFMNEWLKVRSFGDDGKQNNFGRNILQRIGMKIACWAAGVFFINTRKKNQYCQTAQSKKEKIQ
jgi:hypothetical protein